MNAAFAHFVDERLFGWLTGSAGSVDVLITTWGLSEIIAAFITGLSSGKLDPHIRQKSLEYRHEPGSLYTACAVLLTQDNITALHQHALLRHKDPVWPRCLQSLQQMDFPSPSPSQPHEIPRHIADLKAVNAHVHADVVEYNGHF